MWQGGRVILTAYEEATSAAGEVEADVRETTAAVGKGIREVFGFD